MNGRVVLLCRNHGHVILPVYTPCFRKDPTYFSCNAREPIRRLFIASFLQNIFAKKYRNPTSTFALSTTIMSVIICSTLTLSLPPFSRLLFSAPLPLPLFPPSFSFEFFSFFVQFPHSPHPFSFFIIPSPFPTFVPIFLTSIPIISVIPFCLFAHFLSHFVEGAGCLEFTLSVCRRTRQRSSRHCWRPRYRLPAQPPLRCCR